MKIKQRHHSIFRFLSNHLPLITSCTGKKLKCARNTISSMGSESTNEPPSMLTNIGNRSRPILMKCLPLCEIQDIPSEKTYTKYPQRHLFFVGKKFCYVGSHIFQNSCKNENRKFFLAKNHPDLCSSLTKFSEFFDTNTSCEVE